MTIALIRPALLSSIALGALVGLAAVPAGLGWAADPPTAYSSSNSSTSSNQNTALYAVAQARMALNHCNGHDALEQIERVERALLNVQQIHPDPHIDDALKRLDTARMALNANDMRTVDEQLAAVGPELSAGFASTSVPGTASQPVSLVVDDPVYDASGGEIGPVATLVFDPDGQVRMVVISVGDYLGAGEKNIAVARSDIAGNRNHLTLDRSKDQLRQAQNYTGYTGSAAGVGSSTPPR